jgi:uncharacterized membrane protein YfcA
VLFGSALLFLQPVLATRLARRADATGAKSMGATLPLVVFVGGIYGSYFGAVLGVVLLAVLGLLIADGLQRVNALKGLLALTINLAGVAVFLLSTRVAWVHAGCLAAGALVGGTVGVRLARRLPGDMLRLGIAIGGIAVAIVLLVRG